MCVDIRFKFHIETFTEKHNKAWENRSRVQASIYLYHEMKMQGMATRAGLTGRRKTITA